MEEADLLEADEELVVMEVVVVMDVFVLEVSIVVVIVEVDVRVEVVIENWLVDVLSPLIRTINLTPIVDLKGWLC